MTVPSFSGEANVDPTYENLYVSCPHCKEELIYNRCSDLETSSRISRKNVECFECGKPIVIKQDSISEAHVMMIMDCARLIPRKQYMYCMLNLAQSFEMFFAHYLYEELVEKHVANEFDIDVECIELSHELYNATRSLAYARMRNVFVHHVTRSKLQGRQCGKQFIPEIKKLAQKNPVDYLNLPDLNLRKLLIDLMGTTIPEVRNQVVHQHGYRPSLSDVKTALEETRRIVFGLHGHLCP